MYAQFAYMYLTSSFWEASLDIFVFVFGVFDQMYTKYKKLLLVYLIPPNYVLIPICENGKALVVIANVSINK